MAETRRERAIIQAAVDELQEYLLSPEMFWPAGQLASPSGMWQTLDLTPGTILLSETWLAAAGTDFLLSDQIAQIEEIRGRWRANWLRKAEKEVELRLKQWDKYLNELLEAPREHWRDYPREARIRAMVQLLIEDGAPIGSEEERQMARLDRALRGLTEMDGFAWEAGLENGFPVGGWWFLYVRLKQPGR